jgi:periplasmic protein TonB
MSPTSHPGDALRHGATRRRAAWGFGVAVLHGVVLASVWWGDRSTWVTVSQAAPTAPGAPRVTLLRLLPAEPRLSSQAAGLAPVPPGQVPTGAVPARPVRGLPVAAAPDLLRVASAPAAQATRPQAAASLGPQPAAVALSETAAGAGAGLRSAAGAASGALAPVAAAERPADAPLRGTTVAARALPGNPLPAYPEAAREDGQQGTVHLEVQLDAHGQVLAVHWRQRSGVLLLDQAARDAVRAWRFEPARRAGEAVPAALRVAIHFRLAEPVAEARWAEARWP